MDKLNQLLTGNALDFAATFGEATGRRAGETASPGWPVWLQGWIAPARSGYMLGDGEIVYLGVPHRFYFSGLPVRTGQSARLAGAGTVTGLRASRDFSGVYRPSDVAASRTGHDRAAYLRNANGVVITLIARDEEELIELPYGGLRVRLATDL